MQIRHSFLFFLLIGLVCNVAPVQQEKLNRQCKDFALFFAVDNYSQNRDFGNLDNPISDAVALATELEDMFGFETEVYRNPSKQKIYSVLRTYREKRFPEGAQLLVFFSGHGDFDDFETKGYFIPASGPRIDLIALGNIVTQIPCKHTLLAIDACYSGTIDREIAFRGRGSRPGADTYDDRQRLVNNLLRNKSRLLVTSGGKERTPDGEDYSPFTESILSGLRQSYAYRDGLFTFTDLLGELERVNPRPHVGELPGHADGSFVFLQANGVSNNGDKSDQPSRNDNQPSRVSTPPDDMIFIKGGTFQMGDTFGDGNEDEKPVHNVTLDDYYMARTEVTNADFVRFLNDKGNQNHGGAEWYDIESSYAKISGINHSFVVDAGFDNHPVQEVSWYGAVQYCNWLSEQRGLRAVYTISGTNVTANWNNNGYRLPTEAEWEYGARSGGKSEKWAGTDQEGQLSRYANISGTRDGYNGTAPVGSFQSNALGLLDMTGNVLEWCWDWYYHDYYSNSSNRNPKGPSSGGDRVLRGGSWTNSPKNCPAYTRGFFGPKHSLYLIGFRLARSL